MTYENRDFCEDGVTCALEFITPERAARDLQNMVVQRPLRMGKVKAMARDIVAGRFQAYTYQPIAYDDSGAVMNGQHRLKAVVVSGIGVWVQVVRGVKRSRLRYFDTNMTVRTLADQLRMEPYEAKNAPAVAAIVAVLKEFTPGWSSAQLSVDDGLRIYEAHKGLVDEAVNIFHRASPVRPSLIGALYYMAMYKGADVGKMAKLKSVVVHHVATYEGDPFVAVNKHMFTQRGRSGMMERTIETKIVSYAFSRWLKDQTWQQVTMPKAIVRIEGWTDSDLFGASGA